MIRYTIASSSRDIEQALDLAFDAFDARGTTEENLTLKRLLWFEDPSYSPENIVVAKDDSGNVAGVVRIIPRILYRGQQAYPTAGISSVCVIPNLRGQGYSSPLVEYALERCQERGFELAVLFARHALDYYYNRFGFWGVSAYNQLRINLTARDVAGTVVYAIGPFEPALLSFYQATYRHCYMTAFGRFERTTGYWKYAARRISGDSSLEFVTFHCSGQPIGYAIRSSTLVHEVAFVPDHLDFRKLLASLQGGGALPTAGQVVIEVSPQHPIFGCCDGFDVTFSHRDCPFGGHMVKVLDVTRVLGKFTQRLEGQYLERKCCPFTETSAGIEVSWDGSSCRTHLAEASAAPSYLATAKMLGAALCRPRFENHETLLPFNISLSDHL